jgi:hypothetical protein
MSKDQAIGGAILVVCVLIAAFYVVTLFYPSWLTNVGVSSAAVAWNSTVQYWLIAVPVFIAFVAILLIGAWIGWTMATTPPPKPIEEITTEMEEKKEETPAAEQPAASAPASAAPAPEKKKKNQ